MIRILSEIDNKTREWKIHFVCICPGWAQSYEMSYLLHRANFLNQILPHGKCINCDKFNTWIKWNWYKWLLHGVKSIKYGWFKDKTTSKLVEFTAKLLYFAKLCGLLHFLPWFSNIFTQIYLPCLWHFATLRPGCSGSWRWCGWW